jgi:hypothetical protein
MPHTGRLRRGRAKEMLVEATLAVGYDSLSRREGVSPAVVLGVRISTRQGRRLKRRYGARCQGSSRSPCDEVTLSSKGAKSPMPGRKLRSAGTKARTRAGRTSESRAELEKRLNARERDRSSGKS